MTDDDWAEVNAWIEYVHTGSDGFYIESRLVVALRDEVERLRELSATEFATIKALHREIAQLRERLGEPSGMAEGFIEPAQFVP